MIFDKVAKFAGYGFNKCHSAPYALVAYQTAYLKANHPVEFFAASMTLDMGNADKLGDFRQRAGAARESRCCRPTSTGPRPSSRSRRRRRQARRCAMRWRRSRASGAEAMSRCSPSARPTGRSRICSTSPSGWTAKSINKRLLESLVKAGAFEFAEQEPRAEPSPPSRR